MTRANKVTVKASGDNLVATFKCTHKVIAEINSAHTDWIPDAEDTKVGQRESYRKWIIKNANAYDIDYNPKDMRPAEHVRKAQYTNDEELSNDVICANIDDIKVLVDGCKYPIEFNGFTVVGILPKKTTGRGTDLKTLGIKDGKYQNGNWAWADINSTVSAKYKGGDIFIDFSVELISGQLRKPHFNKTQFTAMVEEAIIDAGLATKDELNPPKVQKDKKGNKQDKKVDNTDSAPQREYKSDDEVMKMRKRIDLVQYAEAIGCTIPEEGITTKELKELVINYRNAMMA